MGQGPWPAAASFFFFKGVTDTHHPRWIWPGGGRPLRMMRDDASPLEAASGGREGYGSGVGSTDVGAVEGNGSCK